MNPQVEPLHLEPSHAQEGRIRAISACSEPALLRSWIKNAAAAGNFQVERAARLRLYQVLPSATPGTIEYAVWQSIFALEDLESRKKGKTVRLQRTRNMIKDKGEIGTAAHLVCKPNASAGFQMLLDYELPELTFEALVVEHKDRFEAAVIQAAERRLASHGFSTA